MKRLRLGRIVIFFTLLGVAGSVAVSAFFALRYTTPPRCPLAVDPASFLAAYENVRFPSRDGLSLSGWVVPSASQPATRPAVVLLHVYGSIRAQLLARAKLFSRNGYGLRERRAGQITQAT